MSFFLYGIVTLPTSVTRPLFTLAWTLSKIVKCGYRNTCLCTSRNNCRFSLSAALAGALNIRSATTAAVINLANIGNSLRTTSQF